MAILNEGHVTIGELSYSKILGGKESWQHAYRYPHMGFSLMFMDLGSPNILGTAASGSWFIDFPLVQGKRFAYSLKAGQGIGWVEKKFDYETNYKNFANSTTFNGFVNLSNMLHYRFSERIETSIGIAFVHFSNGSFRKPNLGLNIPAVNFGVSYRPGRSIAVEPPEQPLTRNTKTRYFITAAIAKKERIPLDDKQYTVHTISASLLKPVSIKSHIGGGLDFFYDASNKAELIAESEEDINPTFMETAQIGLHFSYVLQAGIVQFLVEPGFYFHSQYKAEGSLYHRIGTRYRLLEKLYLNTTLKTHFAVADHFEFGLTYQLP
jgi:hypothetical protein